MRNWLELMQKDTVENIDSIRTTYREQNIYLQSGWQSARH